MKRILALMLAAAMILSLAACGTGENGEIETPVTTAAPTEEIQEPTQAPTQEPTEAPAQYEYDPDETAKLAEFFEQKDVNSVRNGEKLFAGYDPADPASWTGGDYTLTWNDDKKLSHIVFCSKAEEADSIILVGCLDLTGFAGLETIEVGEEVQLESITVSECPALAGVFIYCPVWRTARFNCGLPEKGFDVLGEFVQTGFGPGGHGVCVASNGGGYVGYRYFKNDDLGEFVHEIYSTAFVGKKLVAWYSEDAEMYSKERTVDITNAEPPLGDEFVLSASFAEKSAPFAFYEGEAPKASGIIAEAEPGKPVEVDLDFDGKPDIVELVDEGATGSDERARTYSVYVTLGSDKNSRVLLESFEDIESCALRVLDCDMGDDRLELLFNAFGAQLSEIVTAWRVNASGGFIAYPINWMAYVVTDENEWMNAHGNFDASKGIPIATRTEIFDTQYLTARMTIADDDFRMLAPFEYPDPETVGYHGFRELKRDMKVLKHYSGRADEEITLPAGTRFAPISTDLWSWVDIKLEDGSAYRVEIEVRGGEVFIDGVSQTEYCEIWFAE